LADLPWLALLDPCRSAAPLPLTDNIDVKGPALTKVALASCNSSISDIGNWSHDRLVDDGTILCDLKAMLAILPRRDSDACQYPGCHNGPGKLPTYSDDIVALAAKASPDDTLYSSGYTPSCLEAMLEMLAFKIVLPEDDIDEDDQRQRDCALGKMPVDSVESAPLAPSVLDVAASGIGLPDVGGTGSDLYSSYSASATVGEADSGDVVDLQKAGGEPTLAEDFDLNEGPSSYLPDAFWMGQPKTPVKPRTKDMPYTAPWISSGLALEGCDPDESRLSDSEVPRKSTRREPITPTGPPKNHKVYEAAPLPVFSELDLVQRPLGVSPNTASPSDDLAISTSFASSLDSRRSVIDRIEAYLSYLTQSFGQELSSLAPSSSWDEGEAPAFRRHYASFNGPSAPSCPPSAEEVDWGDQESDTLDSPDVSLAMYLPPLPPLPPLHESDSDDTGSILGSDDCSALLGW
jgi:hypothetical protein